MATFWHRKIAHKFSFIHPLLLLNDVRPPWTDCTAIGYTPPPICVYWRTVVAQLIDQLLWLLCLNLANASYCCCCTFKGRCYRKFPKGVLLIQHNKQDNAKQDFVQDKLSCVRHGYSFRLPNLTSRYPLPHNGRLPLDQRIWLGLTTSKHNLFIL